ncbi:MAG: ATP-binding cassette domain-containing protein [Anaerolineae bacterium]|nr:ATP-binding cassette domain-containing protein [Anaerolineae bacterium]
MPAIIQLNDLSKHYQVPVRKAGLKASIGSLFKREYVIVKAVEQINFSIVQGEVVGFLGPNGAGKTTTRKMLSGLLYPTHGNLSVLGYVPSKRQPEFLRQSTLVMGNRQQLVWDLPALDSFDLMRSIYDIPTTEFTRTRDEFIELLELKDLVTKPVRNLSLGERMKMEIAGALLHRPKVLFLDEPTLGLDVTMQRRIRTFVAEYNKRYGATVLLTSHYMADVEALCKRVIVIHHGKLLFDGELSCLVEQFSAFKTVGVTLQTAGASLERYGQVISQDGMRFTLRVPKAETPQVTARLLNDLEVEDLNVEDPPIEDVIEQVFAQGKPEEDPA